MDAVLETFIDRFGEVSFKEGLIRIELLSLSGPEPRVTQRLIMSVQAFMQTLPIQHEMVERLQQMGVIRSVQPAAPELVRETEGPSAPVTEPVSQPQSRLSPPKSPNFATNSN